ncbi:MAG: putative bifunctional diguanylate cyclase/phosphodiesterase [Actinomycetota bacterium]
METTGSNEPHTQGLPLRLRAHLPPGPPWPLAVAASLVAISLGVLVLADSRFVKEIGFLVAIATSVATMIWGVRAHGATRIRIWVLLSGALVVAVLGQSFSFLARWAVIDPGLAPWTDAIYVTGYLLAVTACISMIRSEGGAKDRTGMVDATIFVSGAGILAWTLVLRPMASEGGAITLDASLLLPAAFVVLDLFLLFLLARLAFAPAALSPTRVFIVAAVTSLLVTDLAYLSIGAPEIAPTIVRVGWLLLYVIGAAAACHPSMRDFAEARPPAPVRARARSAVFAFTLVGPLAFAVQSFLERQYEHAVVLSLLMATLLLVFFRIYRTMRLLEGAHEKAQAAAKEASRLAQDVRGREEKFRSLIANATDGVLVVDERTVISYASPAMEKMIGIPIEELIGRAALPMVVEVDVPQVTAALQEVLAEPGKRMDIEFRAHRGDGVERWLSMTATNLLHLPSIRGIVANCRDITERRSLEVDLRHQAFYDSLTGLANRALMRDRTEHALADARRTGALTALFVIDVDDFKRVNDSLGHDAGDAVLVEFANRTRSVARESDTAARIGGDEFAILLERISSPEDAQHVAQRLLEVLNAPMQVRGKEVSLRASIGVALDRAEGHVESLFRDADLAMYDAKRSGKGSVSFFELDMHARAIEDLKLRSDLIGATGRGELGLAYQPQVDLTTGAIVGVEALVRWNHPERGLIMPGEFIELAEDCGEITELGAWVLEHAARQVVAWTNESRRPLTLSVNVSPKQLQAGTLASIVRNALAVSRLPSDRLVLEVTESTLIEPDELLSTELTSLLAEGVRFAIDDFGTGYSSLSALKHLPISLVKIDRAFVASVTYGPEEKAIVKAIIHLADGMGIRTIAEGLETQEQIQVLRSLGCKRGQGYYFGHPVAAVALEELLDEVKIPRLRLA